MMLFLLALSILLSTGRNILSKNLSNIGFGTRDFFIYQAALFLSGGTMLLIFGNGIWNGCSHITVCLAILYGVLLIFAQWFYTAALAKGNTALCSTVYSLGFILPTLSGVVFWSEPFSLLDAFGILCAAGAVIASGFKPQSENRDGRSHYYIFLIIAMLASGGLGIVQKLQQKSAYADEKSAFLLIAFLIAAAASLIVSPFAKKADVPFLRPAKLAVAACIGACFGCCNLLNTTLAGQLPSAVFFPTLNIGVILLSMICGVILFKERLAKRDVCVLLLGGIAILLLNIG